jgi:hypothetical protein
VPALRLDGLRRHISTVVRRACIAARCVRLGNAAGASASSVCAQAIARPGRLLQPPCLLSQSVGPLTSSSSQNGRFMSAVLQSLLGVWCTTLLWQVLELAALHNKMKHET